jgi:hypothetical protein
LSPPQPLFLIAAESNDRITVELQALSLVLLISLYLAFEKENRVVSQTRLMEPYTDWMQGLEREFQERSSFTERRYYKLFYSHLHPFPLLVLGHNPGGETDGTDLNASDGYYEAWEHDYVRFRYSPRYRLARPMCELLAWCLGTRSVNALQQVPVTNVIFRRSRDSGGLGVPRATAIAESKPCLEEMIRTVAPELVLLVSNGAYEIFTKHYCRGMEPDLDDQILTPNGAHHARLYRSATARVEVIGQNVRLLCIAHPSKYSAGTQWPDALNLLRQEFVGAGLHPVESTPYLRPLGGLKGDGQSI